MSNAISEELYNWMNERRIESEVAREMGVPVGTFLAELSPSRATAKLGADQLVPLFEAIRKIGYGDELKGILFRFIEKLKGDELACVPDEDMVPQILRLVQSLGSLSACASRIPTITNADELQSIRTLLSTEVLPVVLQMESIVSARIEAIQPPQDARASALRPAKLRQSKNHRPGNAVAVRALASVSK